MKNKRGLSKIIGVMLVIILSITAAFILGSIVIELLRENSQKISIQSELIEEDFKIKKALINPLNPSEIDITFCCASKGKRTTKMQTSEEEVNPIDFSLVIDRSGSMEQSGWTMTVNGITPIQEYNDLNVPRDAYSSSNTFNVPVGTERLAVSLLWNRIPGYIGSEGSEFALNLRNPSGTWIFGSNRPVVGGIVDPPDSVAAPNEYFSGISTKPQIVYIENPTPGDWQVRVYGWNLRPVTNRPPSQNVNVTVYIGSSSQIIRNPTIISLDAAKQASRDFIINIKDDDFSNYVVFGSYAEVKQSVTGNKNDLFAAIDDTGREGGTAIHTGISAGANDLINNGRSGFDKVMILLTDGQNDIGPDIVIQEANNAKSQGIRIFTIGLTGFVDSDMLTATASSPTDYYYAPDASALGTIFNGIRGRITSEYHSTMLSEKFIIKFINDTYSYSEEITNLEISPLESKVFSFDLSGKITNVNKIEIYPAKRTDQGKYIIGHLLQTYEIK